MTSKSTRSQTVDKGFTSICLVFPLQNDKLRPWNAQRSWMLAARCARAKSHALGAGGDNHHTDIHRTDNHRTGNHRTGNHHTDNHRTWQPSYLTTIAPTTIAPTTITPTAIYLTPRCSTCITLWKCGICKYCLFQVWRWITEAQRINLPT